MRGALLLLPGTCPHCYSQGSVQALYLVCVCVSAPFASTWSAWLRLLEGFVFCVCVSHTHLFVSPPPPPEMLFKNITIIEG